MGLNIKKPGAESDIRELAALTGESLTDAIQSAVREKIERLKDQRTSPQNVEEFLAALRSFQEALRAQRFDENDTRPARELIDELYDEHGLPK